MRMALLLIALIGCSSPAARPQPVASADEPECPAVVPADRSSCPRYLVKCHYNNEARCPFARCVDVASKLVWATTYDHCPIDCPAEKPLAGSPCAPVTTQACGYKGGLKCGYRMACTAHGWAEEELTLCGGM